MQHAISADTDLHARIHHRNPPHGLFKGNLRSVSVTQLKTSSIRFWIQAVCMCLCVVSLFTLGVHVVTSLLLWVIQLISSPQRLIIYHLMGVGTLHVSGYYDMRSVCVCTCVCVYKSFPHPYTQSTSVNFVRRAHCCQTSKVKFSGNDSALEKHYMVNWQIKVCVAIPFFTLTLHFSRLHTCVRMCLGYTTRATAHCTF